jgi:hypothetical protein
VILPISASQTVKITGTSHWRLVQYIFFWRKEGRKRGRNRKSETVPRCPVEPLAKSKLWAICPPGLSQDANLLIALITFMTLYLDL